MVMSVHWEPSNVSMTRDERNHHQNSSGRQVPVSPVPWRLVITSLAASVAWSFI